MALGEWSFSILSLLPEIDLKEKNGQVSGPRFTSGVGESGGIGS
jgi:hypothetical protein